jgi:esterase/lipase superfamily enzyme
MTALMDYVAARRFFAGLTITCLGLSGCASTGLSDMTASLGATTRDFVSARPEGAAYPVQMFVTSTRRDDVRVGEVVGDGGVHHSLVQISVPPAHSPGVVEVPSFGKPVASKHFMLTDGRALTPERFTAQIATHISGRVGADRDVLLFVHGFNTSVEEARFRLAQIVADAHFGGVPVLFTWPSKTNLLSYVSDKERATASRDALEAMMREVAAVPGVGRVHILAHSMGSWLAMEALRENAIAGHPDLDGKLGEVMLAAPDIDLGVFRQQLARLNGRASVSVLVSRADRALNLSSRLAGDRPRLGALDPTKAADQAELERLGVKVYDISAFSAGFIGHSVFANAPDVIRNIGAQLAAPRTGEAAAMAGVVAPETASVDPEAGH